MVKFKVFNNSRNFYLNDEKTQDSKENWVLTFANSNIYSKS